MRKSAAVIFGVVLIAAVLGAGLELSGWIDVGPSRTDATSGGAVDSGRGPVPVVLATAEARPVADLFRTTAEILADDRVTLTSEISGTVEEIMVEDGERVAAGDPIVRFDDEEERAALDAARARLAETKAALERARRLAGKDFATEARVEDARAAHDAAVSALARAEATLADQVVEAPFAGRIGFLRISPGAFLDPGDPIASLVTDRKVRVRLSLPQTIAARVEDGTTLRIHPPGGGDAIETKLDILAPFAEPGTRSVAAEAPLPPGPETPPPGAFVVVDVVLARRDDAVFVPETAVVREGQRTYLYRLDENDRARRVEVSTRARRDGLIEVAGPVTVGDRVIARGVQKLRDGAEVAPQDMAPEQADSAPPRYERTR